VIWGQTLVISVISRKRDGVRPYLKEAREIKGIKVTFLEDKA
jgi:hypothetical protein